MILSSTQRQHPDLTPLPALERYQGLYPSLLRSMQRRGLFPKNCDIVFVTGFGIVTADDGIPANDMPMTPQLALSLREKNLDTMRRILNAKRYDEVYVNLGQNFLKSIEGFEKFTDAKITYATGVLGRKAAHMKAWILKHS